jgi:hypothetical protein
MYTYDDKTMEPIPPVLGPGEKLHIPVAHDESIFHVNKHPRRAWLADGQQPLRKKGHGRAIHISDFILETHGRLALTESQIAAQANLPEASRLRVTDARKIIYPGKTLTSGGTYLSLCRSLQMLSPSSTISILMLWECFTSTVLLLMKASHRTHSMSTI